MSTQRHFQQQEKFFFNIRSNLGKKMDLKWLHKRGDESTRPCMKSANLIPQEYKTLFVLAIFFLVFENQHLKA